MFHLALKLVSCFHCGKWLAEPLVNVLQKHELYPKISYSQ
jgi:ribosomal protein S27E